MGPHDAAFLQVGRTTAMTDRETLLRRLDEFVIDIKSL